MVCILEATVLLGLCCLLFCKLFLNGQAYDRSCEYNKNIKICLLSDTIASSVYEVKHIPEKTDYRLKNNLTTEEI